MGDSIRISRKIDAIHAKMETPDKIAAAEVLGYFACANNVPYDVLRKMEGSDRLCSAFWDGWNARYGEEHP